MAQEFIIKSQDIEDKINQLLPSQGGFQAGVDFSASTMVTPIVDLTETAEGSALRQDLQTAFSLTTATTFQVTNTTTTILTTTGYYKLIGTVGQVTSATANSTFDINITDGITTKSILGDLINNAVSHNVLIPIELVFKLEAGESLTISSGSTTTNVKGSVRQIADVNGNLINP